MAGNHEGTRLGRWANAEAEREFLDLYAQLRAEAWPAPPEESDVETQIGTVHVFRWSGAGTPVVLLPGAGAPSLMWAPLLEHLRDVPILAVDLLGDPGLSRQWVAMDDVRDLCRSLEKVFGTLDIERVHLVGASWGGYVALHHASEFPARVETLTLVEPVFEKVRLLFWLHGIACGIALVTPAPLRRRLAHRLRMNLLATDDKRVRRFGLLGQTKFRRGAPPLVPVTDDQLASLSAPTLVLLGQKSQVHRSKQVLARLQRVAPGVNVEVVAGAGHSLPVDQADVVATHLRSFLARRAV